MTIPKASKIWHNGRLVPWAKANVHVLTHSLHYSGAVFEGLRAYPTKQGPSAIFRMREHIDRLFQSAKLYYMPLPYSKAVLAKAVVQTVKANKLKSCYIRPIAYRAFGEMGPFPLHNPVHVAIAAWPWGAYLGKATEQGVHCITSSWHRISPKQVPTLAKSSGNYANSMLAKIEAHRAGAHEAIMLNDEEFVSEGTGENLFLVKDGKLITPPVTDNILPGITRDTLITLARDVGHSVVQEHVMRDELYSADEAFLCGTATEVAPIVEVDGERIGKGKPGPMTLHLQRKYREVVHGQHPEYNRWLTYVGSF